MRVPQNHRPPRADVIEVIVPVRILQPGSRRATDKERIASDRAERPDRTIDAAGDKLHGALIERPRAIVWLHCLNQSAISVAAVSAESDACTRFSCTSSANSPRIDPGAA